MKDTDYAYAVSRIRANEPSLLTSAEIEQMTAAETEEAVRSFLAAKGWERSEDRSEAADSIQRRQLTSAWDLLCEIAPDIGALEFLIVKNDFQNIKAVMKLFILAQTEGKETGGAGSFTAPFTVDPIRIRDAVELRKTAGLPSFFQEAIQKTYDVLVRTVDGQLADIMLDAAALETILRCAEKSQNDFLEHAAEIIAATSNIKTALRAARTGKDRLFLETALCRTRTLDKEALESASAGGPETLLEYLARTPYGEAADKIAVSAASFEKWCDDVLMEHAAKAKFICLGPEPLAAYYIAKEAEIKSVRILLSCKRNGLPQETIRERMRRLYA